MEDSDFEAIFHSAAVGLALLDADGAPILLNTFCRELLGDDAEQLVQDAVATRLPDVPEPAKPVQVGVGFGLVAMLSRLSEGAGQPGLVLVVGRAQGFQDVVTGLENRDAALRRLQQLLSRRAPVRVELVFIDLDGFKQVNDTCGHMVGDQVLRGVAERLVSVVRPEDVVVRWGGDEFVVILEDPAEGSAPHVCTRIAEALREPLPTSAGPVAMSASCGCAAGTNGDMPADLLHSADQRMYAVKRSRSADR